MISLVKPARGKVVFLAILPFLTGGWSSDPNKKTGDSTLFLCIITAFSFIFAHCLIRRLIKKQMSRQQASYYDFDTRLRTLKIMITGIFLSIGMILTGYSIEIFQWVWQWRLKSKAQEDREELSDRDLYYTGCGCVYESIEQKYGHIKAEQWRKKLHPADIHSIYEDRVNFKYALIHMSDLNISIDPFFAAQNPDGTWHMSNHAFKGSRPLKEVIASGEIQDWHWVGSKTTYPWAEAVLRWYNRLEEGFLKPLSKGDEGIVDIKPENQKRITTGGLKATFAFYHVKNEERIKEIPCRWQVEEDDNHDRLIRFDSNPTILYGHIDGKAKAVPITCSVAEWDAFDIASGKDLKLYGRSFVTTVVSWGAIVFCVGGKRKQIRLPSVCLTTWVGRDVTVTTCDRAEDIDRGLLVGLKDATDNVQPIRYVYDIQDMCLKQKTYQARRRTNPGLHKEKKKLVEEPKKIQFVTVSEERLKPEKVKDESSKERKQESDKQKVEKNQNSNKNKIDKRDKEDKKDKEEEKDKKDDKKLISPLEELVQWHAKKWKTRLPDMPMDEILNKIRQKLQDGGIYSGNSSGSRFIGTVILNDALEVLAVK